MGFEQPIAANSPVYDPERPALSYDLPKAWHHFKRLVQNKEDTREVFPIFEALPWKGLRGAAEAFLRSARGQAIRASEPFLPDLLDDHAALRRMGAPGSVAHAYCDFMEREGLTAHGLVEEFDAVRRQRTPALRRSVPMVLRSAARHA